MPVKLSVEAYQKKKDRNIAYDANNTTRVFVRLNNKTDADILAYLDTVPNKQGLIKELLRNHMSSEGFVYTKEETP